MRARLIALVALAVGLLVPPAASASAADPPCPPGSYWTGVICEWEIVAPGAPGTPGDPGGGDSGGGGDAGPAVCQTPDGAETPCSVERHGVTYHWWASRACYGYVEDDPPPFDDPVWEGRTDGVIVACAPPECVIERGPAECYLDTFWVASVPWEGPSPRELADRAVAAMYLKPVTIGIVPEDLPGRVGLVGMPTWMWVSDPGESTTGPITRSASAGGTTVTATARIDRIVWNMGDGTTVACGVGTPYADSYGKASSPDCGHHYTKQGRYTVTATSYWTVEWAGGGQSGSIPLEFSNSTQITMGEAQVLVQ